MSVSASARAARHLPGEVGIWVFILGDMLVFGLLFGTFIFYRADAPELYSSSQNVLNRNFGALNTLLLLTSSWLVATAVHSARRQRAARVPSLLLGAMACGAGFSIVKLIEYHEKIVAGITLTTNDFFMFYFVLTGLHFVHLLIGMGVLTFLWRKARRTQNWQANDRMTLESGATFWHLVDLLWIVLFPLIYLIK